MEKGFLHALQHGEQSIDLVFAAYGPNGTGGPMKPVSFGSSAALSDFLIGKIGAHEDARRDFLEQLASKHHATMNEVWLTKEQIKQLGL